MDDYGTDFPDYDTDEPLATRVRRGAALLDLKFPGWEELVNPEQLRMHDGCYCVLGQRFHEYVTGLSILGMKGDSNAQRGHGFDIFEGEHDPGWGLLEWLWAEAIQGRRAAKAGA